ncbi:hypothetical protein [Hymenobacter cavernae]|uniref:Uncharacterized protein n=1 Tax=Hymenobacter cavernae TaxID=2044852 RepID=A0ABQ1TX94_9BACT|nr:hypothetical protein [Hymenobacter cavernae]GGF04257.1 hypothetical protein GCM10011383_14150 [Hymenobacter cavernae]
MPTQDKPTWLVNAYHAAACISTAEINRKMAEVYNKTDNFPKAWTASEPVEGQTSSGKPKQPRWKLEATEIDGPQVDFASDLKDGVQLDTTVEKGTFTHKIINDDDEVEDKEIPLDKVQFRLNTSMKGVVHEAGKGDTVDQDFTVQALYADLDDPKLITSIDTSKALEFDAPDDTKRSVAQVLLDMAKDPRYKNHYVFGCSKLPLVQKTVGPFTPRYLKFTTYTGSQPGTLNWNLMVDAANPVAGPDASNMQAGIFDENPLPANAPGVMIISYGKIIEELVVPHGLDAFGLIASQWKSDPDNVQSKFSGSSITLTDSKTYTGEFNSARNTIQPDPANSRIRIDFELDNVQQMKVIYPPANSHGTPPPANWNYNPQPVGPPKYRVQWSGYISFSLDSKGNLTASYSQDSSSDFKIEKTEDEAIWMRILEDIFSLGFHELGLFLDDNTFHDSISSAVNGKSGNVTNSLVNAVELPGGAVFGFETIDWINEGLRIHLKYK